MQHLYFVVAAPALFVPVGIVIVRSHVLPRALGFIALLLGAGFGFVGVASMLTLALPASITSLGSVQALWWFAAGTGLIRRGVSSGTDSLENATQFRSEGP